MSGRLTGRVAVVTGGGDGIGAGIARAFAAEGAHVVVAELDRANGQSVAEGGLAHAHPHRCAGVGPTGVMVNAICPGAKSAAFRRIAETDPAIAASAEADNPMGRLGDPLADVAPVAVFLAGDDCRYLDVRAQKRERTSGPCTLTPPGSSRFHVISKVRR